VIVTEAATLPEDGFTLVIPGPDPTTRIGPLLDSPPTVTTTGPVVAPLGTGAVITVDAQLEGVATVPLKVTTLDPCVDPNPVPETVTEVPTFPEFGLRLVILGNVPTMKNAPLLDRPPAVVTTTFPVVAPVGTGATIAIEFQLAAGATIPLKVTVPTP